MKLEDYIREFFVFVLAFQICSFLVQLRNISFIEWLWIEGYIWMALWIVFIYFIRYIFVEKHFWQEIPKVRGYFWVVANLTIFLLLRYYFYEIWQEPSNWRGMSEYAFFGVITFTIRWNCASWHGDFLADNREVYFFILMIILVVVLHFILRFFDFKYIFWGG